MTVEAGTSIPVLTEHIYAWALSMMMVKRKTGVGLSVLGFGKVLWRIRGYKQVLFLGDSH